LAGKLIKGPGAVIPAAVYDAQREAAGVRARAHAEGLEAARGEATAIVAAAHAEAARVQAASHDDLVRLARRMAEKILARELVLAPGAVADVARQAVTEARGARNLLVRAHPDDLAVLEAARPRLHEALAGVTAIALRPDPTVGRGGCVVETESGSVDARLESQLDALERALVRA
jgi:flagellar biosynthesis/type III secretory pathway protein FliH